MFGRSLEAFIDSLLFCQAWRIASEKGAPHTGISNTDWFHLIAIVFLLALSVSFAICPILPQKIRQPLQKSLASDGISLILYTMTYVAFAAAWIQGIADIISVKSAPDILVYVIFFVGLAFFILLSISYMLASVPSDRKSIWGRSIQDRVAVGFLVGKQILRDFAYQVVAAIRPRR